MSKTNSDFVAPKQHGHRQAMTNTLMRIKTRPEEYTPVYQHSSFNQVTHCDLCGAALTYSFDLIHAEDSDFKKGYSLKVGADCIYNFCEIYFPSIAEQILKTIEKSLETSKIGKFNFDNPSIKETSLEFRALVKKYQQEYGYSFAKLVRIDESLKAVNELIRKEYISKPRIELIKTSLAELKNPKFIKILADHKSHVKKDVDINSKYYKNFHIQYVSLYPMICYYGGNPSNYELSKLDQSLFLEQVNRVLKLASKNKFTQYSKHTQLYQYLMTGTFDRYSAESTASSQIKKLIPLNEAQINKIINSEKYLSSLNNLPKMDSLWHNIFNTISEGKKYEV